VIEYEKQREIRGKASSLTSNDRSRAASRRAGGDGEPVDGPWLSSGATDHEREASVRRDIPFIPGVPKRPRWLIDDENMLVAAQAKGCVNCLAEVPDRPMKGTSGSSTGTSGADRGPRRAG
jgi:hypothetical protein